MGQFLQEYDIIVSSRNNFGTLRHNAVRLTPDIFTFGKDIYHRE